MQPKRNHNIGGIFLVLQRFDINLEIFYFYTVDHFYVITDFFSRTFKTMETWEWVLLVIFFLALIAGIIILIIYFARSEDFKNIGVCSDTPITGPTKVLASSDDGKSINISWQPIQGVDGYNIYFSSTQNFTAAPDTFVTHVDSPKSVATIGPYNPGTYYVKVASIKDKCRSTAEPSSAVSIQLTGQPVAPSQVKIHLYNQAYDLPCGNVSHGYTDSYLTRSRRACSITGFRAEMHQPHSEFSADQTFNITGYTNTYIRLSSDPTQYLGVVNIGGDSHACIADASQFTDDSKLRWTFNESSGTLGLADQSAILIVKTGGFISFSLDGPYVASTSDARANCAPNDVCLYNDPCKDSGGDYIYIVWQLESA